MMPYGHDSASLVQKGLFSILLFWCRQTLILSRAASIEVKYLFSTLAVLHKVNRTEVILSVRMSTSSRDEDGTGGGGKEVKMTY